jgi:hypothetical protein
MRTITFAGNLVGRIQTMPLAIYLGFERDLQQALVLTPGACSAWPSPCCWSSSSCLGQRGGL